MASKDNSRMAELANSETQEPRSMTPSSSRALLGTAAASLSCVSRVPALDSSRIAVLASRGITVEPIVPCGASVRGLDLRTDDIDDDVLTMLQAEMASRGFVVFKEQGVMTGDEQVVASELWGGREIHSTHGVHPEAP